MAGTSGISTVCLVHFSWSHATNTPDRPNRPNEKDRLADFSILLEKFTRKAGLLPARLVQVVSYGTCANSSRIASFHPTGPIPGARIILGRWISGS